MLLGGRWSKAIHGMVVGLVLAGIAFYEFDVWWTGCGFMVVHPPEPAIIAAAKQGCTGCIRTLLRRGADPNAGDKIYGTPLVTAAAYGHLSTARFLLQRGADVNAGIGAGTALCQAMMSVNREEGNMVYLLVSSGAALQWKGDAEHPDYSVFDCLHHFDVGPQPSEEARRVSHLVDHGLANVFDNFPEHRQAELLGFLYDDEIKQLARHGAKLNLDARDREGQTILTRLNMAPGLSTRVRLQASQALCARIRLLVSEGAQYAPEDAEAVNRCIK